MIGNISIMPSQAFIDTKINSKGDEEGNEPCKEYDPIVPSNSTNDEAATNESRGDESSSQNQGSCRYCKYERPSIRKVVAGAGVLSGDGHVAESSMSFSLYSIREKLEKVRLASAQSSG